MIIILEEQVADIELSEQSVLVIETYDFDLPSGMMESMFTEAGQLLGSDGAGSAAVIPAPTAIGQFLRSNGTTVEAGWESVDLSTLVQTAVKTAGYTVIPNDHVLVNASAAGADIDIALPASPAAGSKCRITLVAASVTYKVTINRNGSLVNGLTSTPSLRNAGETVYLEYTGATLGWEAIYIVDGSITLAKLANMATASILGRNTAGTGVPEVLSIATIKLMLSFPAGALLGTTDTQTVTNKRNQKRVVAVTQSATPAINTNNGDVFVIDALAQAITSMTSGLTGTPAVHEMMEIIITDNATARAITWGASFAATTIPLPTTTVISTALRVLFQRNGANTLWMCVGVA